MLPNHENDNLLDENTVLDNQHSLVEEPLSEKTEETNPLDDAPVDATLHTFSPESEEDGKVAHIVLQEDVVEAQEVESPEPIDTKADEPEVEIGTSESEVLSEVRTMLSQEKILEYVPRAEVSELILFTNQLSQGISNESFQSSIDLAKLIKSTFDMRKEAGAVSHEDEQRFTTSYATFNKRKNDFMKKNEEQNTARKLELIQVLKTLLEGEKIANHQEIKQIHEEWKSIRFVARDKKSEIDNTYKSLMDKYYSRKGQEMELMDYDRKINLEKKKAVIEKIRTLLPSEDEATKDEVWKEKAATLSDLQKQWREIGQVRKEEVDGLNMEYNGVVENFYAQRREFFENKDHGNQENADKKEAIIAKMLPYTEAEYTKHKEWDTAAKEFLALQEEWKAIGKAPAEVNSDLWKRYRDFANTFFTHKNLFYKQLDEAKNQNIEAKTALVEKVESLKDSEEWDSARQEIQRLQEEWKKIGPVPERMGNKLWARFREACDTFFGRMRDRNKEQKGEEDENYSKKRTIIERLQAYTENMEDRETVYAAVLEIQKEWKTLGRVPIKFKNAVKADYETAIETFFEIFRQTKKASTPSTGGNFKPRTNNKEFGSNRDRQDNREKPEDALPAHISVKMTKLKKQIQVSQEIVDQYGNNIMFISKNKSGDALRAEIQAKIDVENAKIAEAKKEIKELNAEVAKLKRAQEAEKLADLPVEEVNTPVSEEETTNVVTDNKDEVTSENLEEAVIEESADTSADDAEIEA